MKLQEFTHILDSLYKRTYIPCSLIDDTQTLCFPKYSPLLEMKEEFAYLFVQDDDPLHIVHTYEYLGASFLYEIDHIQYTMLIGPCALLDVEEHEVKGKDPLQPYISSESLESFRDYCANLYALCHGTALHQDHIPISYNRKAMKTNSPQEIFEENLYERRSHDQTRDSYQFELRFLDYVKRGRKDKIDWIFSKINQTYIVELAEEPLEANKLKFASIVTLLTRTAISCGVPLDSAFSLSDALIQGLKQVHTSTDCVRYIKYASYEFSDLIHTTAKNCSTMINQCLRYIDSHLYEKISLQDLSDETGNSSVYISSRFKKELGKTLSDYVLERKIDEAKHLLLFTDYSFQEISTLLNFTSQSHFTQRFKQVCGQTPKQFRQKNFQYL